MAGLRNIALLLLAQVSPASDPGQVEAFAPLAVELAKLEDGLDPGTVAQRIHALGPRCAPILLDALSLDELPTGSGSLGLGKSEHAVLLDGARQLGREAFAPFWSEAASATSSRRRRTAIELVGLVGKSGDLGTAVLAASGLEPGDALDPENVRALEDAATRLLTRDPGTLTLLRPAILHSHPELAGHLIRAVAQVPDERTLVFFADILGLEPRLDLPVLSQIARIARIQNPPFDDRLRAHVRAYLGDPDRQIVRTAAMALAEFQDEEALPKLLELAAGADKAVSGAAFLALERTTGMSLPRRPERWQSWLALEQSWLERRGPDLLAALDGHDVPLLVASLREIACHRLGRQRMAVGVASLLGHEDRRVRLEVCLTLQALGSPSMRESLEQMLRDEDADVARAAAGALHALGASPTSSS